MSTRSRQSRLPFPAFLVRGGLCALLSLSVWHTAAAQQTVGMPVQTMLDGHLVVFPGVQPMMVNDHVMVPMRGVFGTMNANIVWNSADRSVTIHHANDLIRLVENANYATLNGRRIELDAPVIVRNGRTLVPLRFLSETLGASVSWDSPTQTVFVNTTYANVTTNSVRNPISSDDSLTRVITLEAGTVIPFRLDQRLTSNRSKAGDAFTANIAMEEPRDYQRMPIGVLLEGHVSVAFKRVGNTPGVLGLHFDRLRMENGMSYPIEARLVGLDEDSVMTKAGRWVARPVAQNDNLKFVGFGTGNGELYPIVTRANLVTTTLIGTALGSKAGQIHADPRLSHDVMCEPGQRFGIRLTKTFTVRVARRPLP